MKKILYLILGLIFLGLGVVGSILPVLPTFPFILIATYYFAIGSKKVENWFKSTKLYQDNLADYVNCKAMTLKTKLRIMTSVTILMFSGFIIMGIKGIIPGCIALIMVWVFHVLYFTFGIKTKSVS